MALKMAAAFVPLHRWGGVFFGWVLFGVFFTGALTVFSSEITHFATPELHESEKADRKFALNRGVEWLERNAGDARIWRLGLPDDRDPTIHVIYKDDRGSTNKNLSPATLEEVAENGEGGGFFFSYHYSLNVSRSDNPVPFYIIGVSAIFFIVAAVSGFVMRGKILKDAFRLRLGTSKVRAYLDLHIFSGTATFLFHGLMLFSGLLLIYWTYMPAGVNALYDGKPGEHRKEVTQEWVQSLDEPAGHIVPTLSIAELFARGEELLGSGNVSHLIVRDPGRSTMLIEFYRRRDDQIAQQMRRVLLDGQTGEPLRQIRSHSKALTVHSYIAGLHLVNFGGYPMRVFYFILSVAGAFSVAAGVGRFLAKQRASGRALTAGMRLVEILSVTAMSGLVLSCAAYVLSLRFPVTAEQSVDVFCITVLISFVHSIFRNFSPALCEQLLLAGIVWAAAVLMPSVTGAIPLITGLARGNSALLAVSGIFLFISLVCASLSFKLKAADSPH